MKAYSSLRAAKKSIILQTAVLSAVVLVFCAAALFLNRGRLREDVILSYQNTELQNTDLQTSDIRFTWEGEEIPIEDYEVVHRDVEGESSVFLRMTLLPEKPGNYRMTVQDKDEAVYMFDNITVSRGQLSFSWASGSFTASDPIIAALLVWQIGVFLIMMIAFLRLKGPLANSSEAIFTCGVAIFFGMILCFAIPYYFRYIIVKDMYPVWELVLDFASAGLRIASLSRIGLFIFSVLLIISNIALLRHEPRRFKNVLGILLGIGIIGLMTAAYIIRGVMAAHDLSWYSTKYLTIIVNVAGLTFTYGECILLSTIICGLRAARHVPDTDRDYILILGCGFRRDGTLPPLLRGRVDKALEFWHRQKEETGKAAILIPSGGQGPNEPMAEAAAMCNYIRKAGFPMEYVLPEDRSVNTYQNMAYSKALIDQRTPDSSAAKICYSTTNYHVFRSGILANRVGLAAEGLGAKTKWWFWPNAYIRECIGFFSNVRLLILYLAVLVLGSAAVLQLTSVMY